MSLLALAEVSFGYLSGPALFGDVSFSINPGDRIAVVGANGAGKSTLLRLVSGELEPSAGVVIRQRSLQMATAEQDLAGDAALSLFDFAYNPATPLGALHRRLRELEIHLTDALGYSTLVSEYQEQGGYQAEAVVERTLAGLGYPPGEWQRPVGSLSGGERTRARLARALSAGAELLVLDEPTNHLDLAAREWLEAALAAGPAACLLTSHDRTLLSRFANRIIEIERGQVRVFEGGYADYRRAKAVLGRQAWAGYEGFLRRKEAAERAAARRDELAAKVAAAPPGARHSKDFYARKASKVARTGRMLRERVAGPAEVAKPWEEQPIPELSFDNVPRSGDVVLAASGLSKSFGERELFRRLNLTIGRGERWAILGPNGSGKTTLLRVLLGALEPDEGSVRRGVNVRLAAMAQEPPPEDLQRSALEICGAGTLARTLLGCLKLRAERLNSPLASLSDGERTKVELARILTSGANLVCLDEPTNHLEVEAQEALEQVLAQFPGTLVVISHDRAFLEALGPELRRLDL